MSRFTVFSLMVFLLSFSWSSAQTVVGRGIMNKKTGEYLFLKCTADGFPCNEFQIFSGKIEKSRIKRIKGQVGESATLKTLGSPIQSDVLVAATGSVQSEIATKLNALPEAEAKFTKAAWDGSDSSHQFGAVLGSLGGASFAVSAGYSSYKRWLVGRSGDYSTPRGLWEHANGKTTTNFENAAAVVRYLEANPQIIEKDGQLKQDWEHFQRVKKQSEISWIVTGATIGTIALAPTVLDAFYNMGLEMKRAALKGRLNRFQRELDRAADALIYAHNNQILNYEDMERIDANVFEAYRKVLAGLATKK